MDRRKTADLIGESIRQAVLDPDQDWAKKYIPQIRHDLRMALDLVDTPLALREAIELMLWGTAEEPKLPVAGARDWNVVMCAIRFEADHPPHPTGRAPSSAKRKDVACAAGVDVKTIRRWQTAPIYKTLVAGIREDQNRT